MTLGPCLTPLLTHPSNACDFLVLKIAKLMKHEENCSLNTCVLPSGVNHSQHHSLVPSLSPKPSDSLVVDMVALSFTHSSRNKDIILYNWITDTMWWSLGAKENMRNIHMGVKSGPLWLFPVEVGFQNRSLQAYLKVLQQASSFAVTMIVSVAQPCRTLWDAMDWAVAHQAPQSMKFSRREYWSGLPFPSPGDLPDPGIEPGSLALQADS